MKQLVRVEYSNNGLRELVAAGRWWREHHPANETAFDDELSAAVALLKQFPESAPLAQMRVFRGARLKVLLETGHLLVFRYAKSTRLITVVAVRASKATPQRP